MNKIKKLVDKKTLKFILVGVLNTIVGTSVMFIAYNLLDMNYWIASSLNYIVGSIFSYFMNKYFTFKNKSKSIKQIAFFVINISVCYLIAYGIARPAIIYVLSDYNIATQDNVAMIVGMGLFVVLNYIGQRFIVFK